MTLADWKPLIWAAIRAWWSGSNINLTMMHDGLAVVLVSASTYRQARKLHQHYRSLGFR